MAEEKMVERELLADGIRLDGVDYVRGDVITIGEKHAKVLESHGSVGAKGSVKKADEAARERDEAEVRHQRYLSGLGDTESDDAPKPGPRPATK